MRIPGPRSLRLRLLASSAATVGLFTGAMALNLSQLERVGDSIGLVNEVYLPLSALSARMGGFLERDLEDALDATVLQARAIADRGGRIAADDEERAAVAATQRQVSAVAEAHAALRASGSPADRERLDIEVLKLGVLADGRVAVMAQKTARIEERTRALAAVLLVAGVGVGGLSLVWLGAALRPITRLTEQARRVSAGERDVPLIPAGDDEIGTLAAAFAQMLAAVAQRDRSLADLGTWLRRILDAIDAALVVVEDGVVRFGNPAAGALWGAEEGRPLPEVVAGLGEGRHEIRVDERSQEVVVRPFGTSGRLLYGEDTTERVRERERAQRDARLALVGRMLAQVTHEVRNPLNAISLHVELLSDEVQGPEGRALLDVVQREVRRLESVTERYLDLARRPAREPAAEAPVELARAVVALEEEALRRAGIAVEVSGEDGPPVEVDGDALRRGLLNLIRNAREAGCHRLRVRVLRPAGALVFEVEDDGPGMPPEVAARVFEPFFTTRARGTGLGLAITRQAIEDLGGTVDVRSQPGEGTTFRLCVPV